MAEVIREWVATTSLSHLLAVCAFVLMGLAALVCLIEAWGLSRISADSDRQIERMGR